MIVAVVNLNLQVRHREASDQAAFQTLNNTFFDSRNVFLGNGSANRLVFEFETLALFERFDANKDNGLDFNEYLEFIKVATRQLSAPAAPQAK